MSTAHPEPADIKVSVAIFAYNHETFIAQAIESVLMQQTDFEYEVIIGEDCSTDDTRAIVRAYGERYLERIRLLLPESNQGGKANLVATLNACRGEYIALLDGDDYWTDPLKLQKQVDFLDRNPDFVLSCHDVDIVDFQGTFIAKHPGVYLGDKINLDDYLSHNYNVFHPASVVLRRGILNQIPDWFYRMRMADWPLFMLYLQRGPAHHIAESMAVWRHHTGGIWSMRPLIETYQKILQAIGILRGYLGKRYYRAFNRMESHYLVRLAGAYSQRREFTMAGQYAMAALRIHTSLPRQVRIKLIKIVLSGRFPKAYEEYTALRSVRRPR